jgi:drug/metabolite transporter (DMT)-like permease
VETAEQGEGARQKARVKTPSGAALNWTLLFILVLIWGSTFAGIRIAVETISPVWVVSGRLTSGTIFLALMLLIQRAIDKRPRADAREKVTAAHIYIFSIVGICFTAIPFILYAIAAKTTGSAVMAICNGATPSVTAIAAHLVLKDRLTPRRVIGVAMGFLGLAVLVWPEAQKGFEGSSLFGIILAIIGAALYSGGNVGTRMAPKLSPIYSSLLMIGAGAIAALIIAFVLEPFPEAAGVKSITAVILLGLLPTAFAMALYVWLIQRSGAVFVSFTTYLSPLWATFLGVTFLSEPLHWSMIGALALILAGVAVANRSVRLLQTASSKS